jgi:cytidylate kinase
VVFPRAELKFFMTASARERARRRQKDFFALGVKKNLGELEREIRERDRKDSTRKIAPLRKAADAEEVDTTGMTLDQQVRYIVGRAEKILKKGKAARRRASA